MRNSILLATVGAMTLAGCSSPEPVVLPKDALTAGKVCFVAAGIAGREGKSPGDAVTYEEFIGAVAYPMAAAAQIEPFSVDTVGKILTGVETLRDEISAKDYEGAIPTCKARFGIDEKVELPKDDADALLRCVSLSGFMRGADQSVTGDFGARTEEIAALFKRLESRMQSDPAVLAKLVGNDGKKVISDAAKSAFAEGAPDAYLKACEARFPAKN